MKTILSLIFVALLGGLAAACAPASLAPTVRLTSTPSAAPAAAPTLPAVRVPSEDLSLIAATGRPQFLNSFAHWCTTCTRNRPIVNGLAQRYGDRIDFIDMDIDKPETEAPRQRFNMAQRSQYALIDPQGNIVQRWFGLLDEAQVAAYLDQYLAGG